MAGELQTSLLIGNGLNQCLEDGIPWSNLLERIASQFQLDVYEDIPMPLEFERLINVYLQENPNDAKDIYNRVKQNIADLVSGVSLSQKCIHKEIAKLNISSIITTNYDLLLERVYDPAFVPNIHKGVAQNQSKYITDSVGSARDVSFYHAHGCITAPSTICLGYEHYMGMIEKIRAALNRIPRGQDRKKIVAVLDGSKEPNNTWMEKFYTSNVGIIGFGLYECESDFWWLLTHRASLYYTDESGNHSHITNTISYYDVIDDLPRKSEGEKAKAAAKAKEIERKHHLLDGLHVNVKKYLLSEMNSGSYYEAYQKIFENIQKKGV